MVALLSTCAMPDAFTSFATSALTLALTVTVPLALAATGLASVPNVQTTVTRPVCASCVFVTVHATPVGWGTSTESASRPAGSSSVTVTTPATGTPSWEELFTQLML